MIRELANVGPERLWFVGDAFRHGMTLEEVFSHTKIDPWFLVQIEDLVAREADLRKRSSSELNANEWLDIKQRGFSDLRLAELFGEDEFQVRKARQGFDVRPVFKRVDTCAAEFPSSTAYLYSTYEEECEAEPSGRDKIIVLGGGPNRIGQGIEFDYCCCHASYSLRDAGYETIMMNSNPETVSTDYDTSSRLYFEPLTVEDVLNVIDVERPEGCLLYTSPSPRD